MFGLTVCFLIIQSVCLRYVLIDFDQLEKVAFLSWSPIQNISHRNGEDVMEGLAMSTRWAQV